MLKLGILWILLVPAVFGSWSSDELALYDLVEELNMNFYDFFGITNEATTAQIKKAYRKLSLEVHPDRNRAEDAADKFRQVVAVYDILKSAELREKYDNVLEFGLPDWRQPIYYYRKMRKFTWYEALAVLLALSTLAHYLMMWAAYYEKSLVLGEVSKKSKKKKSADSLAEETRMLNEALAEYHPNPWRLLPFLIVEGGWAFIQLCAELTKEKMTAKEEIIEEENEEEEEWKPRKPAAPRQEFHYEMATDIKAVSVNDPAMEEKFKKEAEDTTIKKAGDAWSFDDLSLLIRLSTEKYPPGTPNRWELMARQLNRSADETTAMAGKLKNMKQEEYTKLLKGQQCTAVNESSAGGGGGKEAKTEAVEWQQHEQKLFETALQKYPKGTEERWERVAEAVPGKTKEQCVARFKELAELVRRKKAST